MKCDSQASLLARNLATPCLGREPKARVATIVVLCKTYEAINGELKCVVFLLLCVVNLRDGVISISLCNLFKFKGLHYKV
jgi:hypothetical protein